MPMHRRRVYLEHGSGRKARMEGLLALSIYVSALILVLSLAVCLPDLISSTRRWLEFGAVSGTEGASALVVLCEVLMTISGAYLLVALFIRSHGGQGPR